MILFLIFCWSNFATRKKLFPSFFWWQHIFNQILNMKEGPEGVWLFKGMGNKVNMTSSFYLKTIKFPLTLPFSYLENYPNLKNESSTSLKDLPIGPYMFVKCLLTHGKFLPKEVPANSKETIRWIFYHFFGNNPLGRLSTKVLKFRFVGLSISMSK